VVAGERLAGCPDALCVADAKPGKRRFRASDNSFRSGTRRGEGALFKEGGQRACTRWCPCGRGERRPSARAAPRSRGLDHTAEAAIAPALAELLAELRLNPSGIQHRRGACQSPSPSADNDAFKCALGSPLRLIRCRRSVPLCRSSSPTCRYLLVVFKGRARGLSRTCRKSTA